MLKYQLPRNIYTVLNVVFHRPSRKAKRLLIHRDAVHLVIVHCKNQTQVYTFVSFHLPTIQHQREERIVRIEEKKRKQKRKENRKEKKILI
jgi:hypothetical protein